jgi:hypothetical protein
VTANLFSQITIFQLDSKDQALDELEMRQSQIISGVTTVSSPSDAKPETDIAADGGKTEVSADDKPASLSQEEREAFETLKEQVKYRLYKKAGNPY